MTSGASTGAPPAAGAGAVTDAIVARFRERTAESRRRFEEAAAVLPGGVTRSITYFRPYPVTLADGAGCTVHDVDGNGYLDLLNNFTALIHGHNPAFVVSALVETATGGTVHHAPIDLQTRLAALICRRVGSVERIRFTNSGSEAVTTALRLARATTGRPRVLKMEGAFHGSGDAIAMSVHPSPESPAPPTAIPDVPGLPPGLAGSVLVAPYNDVDAVAWLLRTHGRELAAVIVEPLTWAGGAIPAEPRFLEALREMTSRYGILLVLDEVVTFRLSWGGAQEVFGIAPDLTVLGKTIGGGLPIGAVGGRAEIMERLDPRQPGHLAQAGTFSGSPLSMAAGLAALEALDPEALQRLQRQGDAVRAALSGRLADARIPAQVTGMGSLGYVHFGRGPIRDYRSAIAAGKDVQRWLHLALLNRGVMLDPRGQFALSTPMAEGDLDRFLDAAEDAWRELRPVLPR